MSAYKDHPRSLSWERGPSDCVAHTTEHLTLNPGLLLSFLQKLFEHTAGGAGANNNNNNNNNNTNNNNTLNTASCKRQVRTRCSRFFASCCCAPHHPADGADILFQVLRTTPPRADIQFPVLPHDIHNRVKISSGNLH